MDLGQIALFLSLGVAFLGLAALVWAILSNRKQAARLAALEGVLEAEAQAEHEHRVELGRQGVQVRESLKEMRRAAMSEGRKFISTMDSAKILTDKEEQARIAAGLKDLARRYPRVAQEVGDGLIAEFKLGSYRELIQGIIEEALKEDAGKNEGQPGGFYGI